MAAESSGPTGAGHSHQQLALDVELSDPPSFASFVSEDPELVHLMRRAATGQMARPVYLFGKPGVGKTHLLFAAVAEAGAAGAHVATVPLGDDSLDPALVDGLEQADLVCLDDLDAVAGQPAWEVRLFNLYNRLEQCGGRLVVTAAMAPARLPIRLADLRSRLTSALALRLRPLSEAGCRRALQGRAQRRGFDLSDEVLEYLLRRVRRDIGSLATLLDVLEACSLSRHRRITVPFVRDLLAESVQMRGASPCNDP